MSRRVWALVVGGALAIGAVIAGSFIAIGQAGDSSTTPTGDSTKLRLEAVNDEVSCGSVAAVHIYLDDLETRESPRTPGSPFGVVGFELPIQYDPSVLRILGGSDLQLNNDLGRQDVDDDGLVRQFLTVADLHEDHLGRVMIGAASFVPASQGLADNIEEGVDPVSKGEPLLLMTVRFTPVGMGTTTVRIEGWDATLVRLEPSVVDPDRGKYEPLSLKEAEITVRGGDCPATPTPPPSATPEPTRFIPPTQTPVLWQTVEPLDALSAGRDDCPQDWVVYTDPQDRFSICYPSDLEAAASDVSLYAHIDRNVEENSEISVIVSWSEGAGQFYGPSSPETCEYYTSIVEGPLSSTFVETNIVGRMVPSCFTVGPIQSSLHGSIAVAEDGSDREGFVLFTLNFVASDLSRIPANGLSIVETLVVGAR